MYTHRNPLWLACIAMVGCAMLFLENWASAQEARPHAAAGIEVLTRGPVHEAFAETVTFDPEPGIVVTEQPPRSIEELPPEQKPQGANVAWIPGYWAWDDDRDDFIWISGVWRSVPPGRQWMSGYWASTSVGFQWTSGYWADADATEIERDLRLDAQWPGEQQACHLIQSWN